MFSSRLFSELGLRLGLGIMGSETHGMSQRGGSVIAHLKLGDFQSPMIRRGTADILYSFEENETYRTLKFLRGGSVCFVNLANADRFNRKVLDYLKQRDITFKAFDASGAASKIGSIRSANTALIGFSVGTGLVPFKYKDVRYVLERMSQKKQLAANLKAFEIGIQEGKLKR